ncbi:hypothetical protein [Anaerovibrio sp. JC8]|uniref:hypothetical protein n=1 Tax=Anaerovibrio sp. JC8 TaxID=1240085 RepID=UPI001301F721|nr:hypothetical protein [Anaerovibrio sp. JC8]
MTNLGNKEDSAKRYISTNKAHLSEGIKIHPPETASLLLSGDLAFLGKFWN